MDEILKRIKELKDEDYSYRQIGDKLGLHKDAVRSKYRRYKTRFDTKDVKEEPLDSFNRTEDKNTLTINTKSTRIKTVEDALKYAEVDLDVWEVDTVQINSWEVARKNTKSDVKFDGKDKYGNEQDNGDFNTQTLWQVKIKLKKKIEYPVLYALENIVETLRDNPPKLPSVNYSNCDCHLLEISLVDHHFGKLCINGEGIEESENLYVNAVHNLLTKCKGFDISQILLPLGSDFFHIDNKENKTAKGTPQDVDGHITDIFKKGCMAIVKSIYMMREIAPVKILYIPGNHDFMTSFYLCEFINAWFRQDDNVIVDTNKLPRKYEFYGKNLIGFTHGNEEKINDLSRLIMSENINDSRIKSVEHLEFHKGHFHKRKEMQYSSGDTVGNVKIVELPSLSGTDMWHYTKGFVGSKRAAEAHIYSPMFGNIGNFVCDINEII